MRSYDSTTKIPHSWCTDHYRADACHGSSDMETQRRQKAAQPGSKRTGRTASAASLALWPNGLGNGQAHLVSLLCTADG